MESANRSGHDISPDESAAGRAAAEAECARLAAELERSRAHFRDVIERNADAILVVSTDGTIRFANDRAAELFRRTRDDLLDTPFGFPMVAGETTELDLVHPEGARVVEMRVVESEWEGEPACIASLRDVTERRRTEAAARRLIAEQAARGMAEAAARRFRFLADASVLLSARLDYAGTLRTIAQLCVQQVADWAVVFVCEEGGGLRRLEVAHRDPALQRIAEQLRALPLAASDTHPVLEVVRTREPLLVTDVDDAKLATLSHDEQHRELSRRLGISSFMIVPLVARDLVLGAIALVSADADRPFTQDDLDTAHDLALRAGLAFDNARLYRIAQEANQGKSNLLAVISHDLRTPLNSIVGNVELLELGIPDTLTAASLQRVERIRLSAMHLVYLIDELLSFARLDGGHEEMRLQQFDACDVARDVAAVIEPLAQGRGLAFELQVPAEAVPVNCDPDRLRQVLLNLVGNAVKYTEQGSVRVALQARDDRVLWEVSDTGVGIDSANLDHIFEPFWQADPTQRARNGGTGLGLSVVRRLVQLMGGEVGVTSERGRGSTFSVALPRRLEAVSATG